MKTPILQSSILPSTHTCKVRHWYWYCTVLWCKCNSASATTYKDYVVFDAFMTFGYVLVRLFLFIQNSITITNNGDKFDDTSASDNWHRYVCEGRENMWISGSALILGIWIHNMICDIALLHFCTLKVLRSKALKVRCHPCQACCACAIITSV